MGGFCAVKHGHIDLYPATGVELARQATLTVWDCLAAYHDDMVLVGGMAVRLLTLPAQPGEPGPVTLDVDFGISIGSSDGVYGSIRDTLAAHDFRWAGGRFMREVKGMKLYVDLLTDDGRSDGGSVVVNDGLSVSILPGIDRALSCFRKITVTGKTLLGLTQTEHIRVAEVGPLLVLKLNAFGGPIGRKAAKDAHDILYLLLNYVDGASRSIVAFHEEKHANRGMAGALGCLQRYFGTIDAQAPMACAAFRLGDDHESAALATESLRIRQQCVTLADALLA